MFYFTNYEVLIAISKIMKSVINDEQIDMISKFYNFRRSDAAFRG